MLNVINIVGRLTADPKYTATNDGKSVVRFTIACQRDFADKSGQKQTDFVNCLAWKQTAEFITRHFTKGAMMCLNGRLQINTWEKDGQKHSAPEIVVQNAYFYGTSAKPEKAETPDYPVIEADDDELPFG